MTRVTLGLLFLTCWFGVARCGSNATAATPVATVVSANTETEETERARGAALEAAGAYFVVNANLAALSALDGLPALFEDMRNLQSVSACSGALRVLERVTFANTLLMEGFNDQLVIVGTGPDSGPTPGFDFERCAKVFDDAIVVSAQTHGAERTYVAGFERFPMEGECASTAQCPRLRDGLAVIPRVDSGVGVLLEFEVATVLLRGLLEITGGGGVQQETHQAAFRMIWDAPRLRVRVRSSELEMVLFLKEHQDQEGGHAGEDPAAPEQAAALVQQMLRAIASEFGRSLASNLEYAAQPTVTVLHALEPLFPLVANLVVTVEGRTLVSHVSLNSEQLAAVISGARAGLRRATH